MREDDGSPGPTVFDDINHVDLDRRGEGKNESAPAVDEQDAVVQVVNGAPVDTDQDTITTVDSQAADPDDKASPETDASPTTTIAPCKEINGGNGNVFAFPPSSAPPVAPVDTAQDAITMVDSQADVPDDKALASPETDASPATNIAPCTEINGGNGNVFAFPPSSLPPVASFHFHEENVVSGSSVQGSLTFNPYLSDFTTNNLRVPVHSATPSLNLSSELWFANDSNPSGLTFPQGAHYFICSTSVN